MLWSKELLNRIGHYTLSPYKIKGDIKMKLDGFNIVRDLVLVALAISITIFNQLWIKVLLSLVCLFLITIKGLVMGVSETTKMMEKMLGTGNKDITKMLDNINCYKIFIF